MAWWGKGTVRAWEGERHAGFFPLLLSVMWSGILN